MFINRKSELTLLSDVEKLLVTGKGINAAILGLRRIGKTELILEFRKKLTGRKIITPYLNLQSSIASPKRFCLDYISVLLEEVSLFKKIELPPPSSIENRIQVTSALLGNEIYSKVTNILDLLSKDNYEEALRNTFLLPEEIALIMKLKGLFFIDEFQELDEFKNYGVNVFATMRTVIEKQEKIKYVITGSLISFVENIVTDPQKPFFNQFKLIALSYFDKYDTRKLTQFIWDYPHLKIRDEAYITMYNITGGHPFYSKSVAERAFFEARYNNFTIDSLLVEFAFLRETLDHDGKLNILFEYIYNYSLEKVERKGSLKIPLLILAEEDGLILTEIARRMNRPSGQVSNYMKSLLKTDLVVKKDSMYYLRDQVFRFWLSKTSLGKDLGITFKKNIVSTYIHELKEKYLRISSELGRLKEFELYFFINTNQGKSVSGVYIPLFKKIIKNYILPNGDEIDLLAINDKTWAFEMKWKNKRTGEKELKKFKEKLISNFYVYISKGGYTEKAQAFAKENSFILWDENDLNQSI